MSPRKKRRLPRVLTMESLDGRELTAVDISPALPRPTSMPALSVQISSPSVAAVRAAPTNALEEALLRPGRTEIRSVGVGTRAFVDPAQRGSAIRAVENLGANVIRWQINADEGTARSDFAVTEPAGYLRWIRERAIPELKTVLPILADKRIGVIVDLHSYPEVKIADGNISSATFNDPARRDALLAAWRDIATAVSPYSNVIAYDTNEPHDAGNAAFSWASIARQMVTDIRKIDPTTPIIIAAPMGNPDRLMNEAPLSVKNERVVYSFNYYGTAAVKKYIDQRDGRTPLPKNFEAEVAREIQKVANWAQKQRVPVIVTEFAVPNLAPDGARYLAAVMSEMERAGFNYSLHGAVAEAPIWKLTAAGTTTIRQVFMRNRLFF